MNAEQRASIRKKISLNVLINHDLTYSKRWKVRDLSMSGAWVEMAGEELAPGTPIEAVLSLKERDEYILYRLPAQVVRMDGNGVALRFSRYDYRAYTALVNLLYSA